MQKWYSRSFFILCNIHEPFTSSPEQWKNKVSKKKKSTLWQLKIFSFVFFYKSDAAFFIEEMKFEKKKGSGIVISIYVIDFRMK